jgi:hypothetical protein
LGDFCGFENACDHSPQGIIFGQFIKGCFEINIRSLQTYPAAVAIGSGRYDRPGFNLQNRYRDGWLTIDYCVFAEQYGFPWSSCSYGRHGPSVQVEDK